MKKSELKKIIREEIKYLLETDYSHIIKVGKLRINVYLDEDTGELTNELTDEDGDKNQLIATRGESVFWDKKEKTNVLFSTPKDPEGMHVTIKKNWITK